MSVLGEGATSSSRNERLTEKLLKDENVYDHPQTVSYDDGRVGVKDRILFLNKISIGITHSCQRICLVESPVLLKNDPRKE